jgi:hypothetical protein
VPDGQRAARRNVAGGAAGRRVASLQLARSDPRRSLTRRSAVTLFEFVVTFGSTAMGSAIMALGRRMKRGPGPAAALGAEAGASPASLRGSERGAIFKGTNWALQSSADTAGIQPEP